jgi:pantothenate kinase-related protein Tda10
MEEINDSVYEQDIHPLVERIALICKQHDMPMFLTVQEAQNSARTTCLNANLDLSGRLKNLYEANQSWDLDDFLAKVIARAQREGHNSRYMKAMGIPMQPDSH